MLLFRPLSPFLLFHFFDNTIENANSITALFLFLSIPFWPLWWFLGPLSAKIKRSKISNYAYDIELTPNVYKTIRDKSGNLGICYWYNWYNCCLLLVPKYNRIQRIDNDGFIVSTKGKFGIFNAKLQKMVVKPMYSSYEIVGNFVNFSNKNTTEKFNKYGERIML